MITGLSVRKMNYFIAYYMVIGCYLPKERTERGRSRVRLHKRGIPETC